MPQARTPPRPRQKQKHQNVKIQDVRVHHHHHQQPEVQSQSTNSKFNPPPPNNHRGFLPTLRLICDILFTSPWALLIYFFIFHYQPCFAESDDLPFLEVHRICMLATRSAIFEWSRWFLGWLLEIDMFYVQSVATCGALSWLLYRAWLTLWKPVPELISILGVEVPDAPNVSLAGIKADAITIQWLRPEPSRPVHKYLIQVNGVNVGETLRQETAITVTGLKPAHFYNVRVIAVGSNNFQAGSSVIRCRTYGKDGRPILDNGRIPSSFSFDEPPSVPADDSSDESPAGRGHSAGIETAALPETASQNSKRESSGTGQRRNTIGRKHSPSNAVVDQVVLAARKSHEPEESMQQLNEKFEAIRKEISDVNAQAMKDKEDFDSQYADLLKEREEKRQALKEKEEATEKLRKDINTAESRNRAAQTRKSQKEKILRDKEAANLKMIDDMSRWKREAEEMRKEREAWDVEMEEIEKKKATKVEELRKTIRKRQNSLNGLEEEMKLKGLKMKELEEERQHLPGAQDDQESINREKQKESAWAIRERELLSLLNNQITELRMVEGNLQQQSGLLAALNARHVSKPLMYHGNSSGVDFDPNGGQGKTKSRRSRNRRSRTGTLSSPVAGFPMAESTFSNTSTYNSHNITSPTFAPGPYFDMSNDVAMVPLSEQMSGMSEADIRALTAGAPLSPTATSLLPSNIFSDDDLPSPPAGGAFGPAQFENQPSGYDNGPQSPGSSSRSASLVSSPRDSAQNLALYGVSAREYGPENERRSLTSPKAAFGTIGTPSIPEQPATHKGLGNIANMFSSFPRSRGKTMQDGPALGTLKQGQSQSFPRSMEDPTSATNRPRRISFSSPWYGIPGMHNLLSRNTAPVESSEGNAPAPLRNVDARKRRGFDMFSKSEDRTVHLDRNPSSPRPLSIASSDLPRPSTDSAPFGWPPAEGMFNRNSPLATNWSNNPPQSWSRNPSRRPSLQHGSTSALNTGIASDDDDFLPSETLTSHTQLPAAGVIGTRPPSSSQKQITPRLNPTAPAFERTTPHSTPALQHSVPVVERSAPGLKGMFSSFTKFDKDKKGKEKSSSSEGPHPEEPTRPNTSPSISRMSRDTPSIRTQNSVSESHENLSLEATSSNTPSEVPTPSASSTKEKESSFRRVLRKGSSTKFGMSSIQKNSGLFGSKKQSSSTMNSERDSMDEYGEDLLGKSVDSVTSSPMIGSLGSSDSKNKDPRSTPKEGRMSVNWGKFGFKRAGAGGRESSEVDRSEDESII